MSYIYEGLKILVGKKVIKAYYNPRDKNDGGIILECNDGLYHLEPMGDCCAHAYIQHCDGSEALINATIKEIEDLEYKRDNDHEDDTWDMVMDVFGHRIHTDKGILNLDMRCEHNGYYGGELAIEKVDSNKFTETLVDF